ncbi:creatine kinase, putative [Perkinsus marinus ATCC 50983]|uniref:Creatine kinase, putative n=1 Tax=Perkinsus marinus (strain ATCC 50983 / TXsc) TaxID=423536 RepID=C5L6V6_PERM5|nr:creatine kinase, putative [Perkinsus marinus ATCC 50983]EER07218.1 creatine kinase, putative [Perkinsus marinus ATCC 50983]|eukprot:XP_002775402.1 creatine kinase, putative [Perkinsus marinus ATCC 50983]
MATYIDKRGELSLRILLIANDAREQLSFSTACSTEGLVVAGAQSSSAKRTAPKKPANGNNQLNGSVAPAYSTMPGLGDHEFPGFPHEDCPADMPDLSEHHSVMADVLKADPEIYAKLKGKKTPNGVSLAKCIKTGMDNKGHPMIKTVGMVAGDEESYEVFKELFDPVIDQRHGGYPPDAKHPTDLDYTKLLDTPIDPSQNYVISTRVRTGRSVRGIRLPPSCTKEERREVERVLTKALKALGGDLAGDYYPLAGSDSYPEKPGGMSAAEEHQMREDHFLFQEPDSTLLLSSGMGRHWPDARGIFANDQKNFLVWVNEEDHMRIISMQKGADIKTVFTRFCDAVNKVQEVVKQEGYDFMHNDHLGYVLTCPSNLGTGLRASVMVKVPLLSARPDFKDISKSLHLQARGGAGVDSASVGGIWDISNSDRIGKSEVELVNIMISGCSKIVQMEQALEKGDTAAFEALKPASTQSSSGDHPDYSTMPGLGDDEFPGFPHEDCPPDMPDLSEHHSVMADVLKADPEIYAKLKDKKTPNGVSLAKCIKTGMDNKGHPMIKTVGMVAGDEESYEVFKELFDPVIDQRHGGYPPDAKHPTDLDYTKLLDTPIDPSQNYVISTRVRTGRSVRGIRLPPSCTKEERREVERVLTKALKALGGDLAGDYYPLAGSDSYPEKPGGMSAAEEHQMREDHFLFQEPDSTLLLSSGMGRHWPDARGIFANDQKNFLVWVNEEDHMRIISMQKGADIKTVFTRFCDAVNKVQEVVKQEGYDFMHNDHLGYVLTCPSNLGTGLRASVMVKVPLLSARPDFKDICKSLHLQARGGAGVDSASVGGIWDISNSDRIGKSEVELVNIMISGCSKIVQMEQALEKGDTAAFEAQLPTSD